MPCSTMFSELPRNFERMTIGAAVLSTRKNILFTVAQLPIADRSNGYIYQEGNTGCEDTNQGGSYPALAGVKSCC